MDVFWYYASTLVFIVALMALFCVYRYYLGNRLIANANKLKSQMANIKQNFPELEDRRREIVANGIEGLGIDGLLDELGVPKAFKPLAQGFIDKIAQNPEIIKSFADKLGVKLPDGKSSNEEIKLL